MTAPQAKPTMTFGQFARLLRADFYRYDGSAGVWSHLQRYFMEPGAKFTFWLRLSSWLNGKPILLPAFAFAWIVRRHYEIRYGISIPTSAAIGGGLFISHFGGIVVNREAVIGRNCNLGNCVTVGLAVRGPRVGCPTIGDDVFIGPGARIFGRISVGDRAAIGANSVVLADVPSDAVVAGIPAKIVSMRGSEGYINFRMEDVERQVNSTPNSGRDAQCA